MGTCKCGEHTGFNFLDPVTGSFADIIYWCCKSATGNCSVEKYDRYGGGHGITPLVVKCDGNRLNLTQQCQNGDSSVGQQCNFHPSDTFRNGKLGVTTSRSHVDVCQDSRLAIFLNTVVV